MPGSFREGEGRILGPGGYGYAYDQGTRGRDWLNLISAIFGFGAYFGIGTRGGKRGGGGGGHRTLRPARPPALSVPVWNAGDTAASWPGADLPEWWFGSGGWWWLGRGRRRRGRFGRRGSRRGPGPFGRGQVTAAEPTRLPEVIVTGKREFPREGGAEAVATYYRKFCERNPVHCIYSGNPDYPGRLEDAIAHGELPADYTGGLIGIDYDETDRQYDLSDFDKEGDAYLLPDTFAQSEHDVFIAQQKSPWLVPILETVYGAREWLRRAIRGRARGDVIEGAKIPKPKGQIYEDVIIAGGKVIRVKKQKPAKPKPPKDIFRYCIDEGTWKETCFTMPIIVGGPAPAPRTIPRRFPRRVKPRTEPGRPRRFPRRTAPETPNLPVPLPGQAPQPSPVPRTVPEPIPRPAPEPRPSPRPVEVPAPAPAPATVPRPAPSRVPSPGPSTVPARYPARFPMPSPSLLPFLPLAVPFLPGRSRSRSTSPSPMPRVPPVPALTPFESPGVESNPDRCCACRKPSKRRRGGKRKTCVRSVTRSIATGRFA